jgi:hypothetical protein
MVAGRLLRKVTLSVPLSRLTSWNSACETPTLGTAVELNGGNGNPVVTPGMVIGNCIVTGARSNEPRPTLALALIGSSLRRSLTNTGSVVAEVLKTSLVSPGRTPSSEGFSSANSSSV